MHIASWTQKVKEHRHKGVIVQRYLAVIRLRVGRGGGDKQRRPKWSDECELDFVTIDCYRDNLGGKESDCDTSETGHVTPQERENQQIRQDGRGRRPRAKFKKRGKELVRCVQRGHRRSGAQKKGRTYGNHPYSTMPYPLPLGTTCIGELIVCFITIPFIPSSPLPFHEVCTAVLIWGPAAPILLASVNSGIAFDSS